MNNKRRPSLVPALDKGFDILKFMVTASEPQTLTQISRSVGRSVSEIQRMVACLQQRSYLVRNSEGAFQLSSKLFRLAHAHPLHRNLLARAIPAMEDCQNQTNETVLFSIIAEDRLLLLGQVKGRERVRLTLQPGLSQDPLQAVSGRCILSDWTGDELGSWMKRRSLSQREREDLLKHLALIRKRGFDESISETIEGVHGVSVPVTLPGGRTIASVGTPWLQLRHTASKQALLVRHLRTAAQRIARAYEPNSQVSQ